MALKILEKTRLDRVNCAEPQFPAGPLEPPDWLDAHGLEHWKELAPLLHGVGLLTQADRPALAQLCSLYSKIRKKRPMPSQFDRAEYRRMLCEFGLTPSSRSRIRSSAERPGDALQEFLARKNG